MKKEYYELQWYDEGCWRLRNRFETLQEAQEWMKSDTNTIRKDLKIIHVTIQDVEILKYDK